MARQVLPLLLYALFLVLLISPCLTAWLRRHEKRRAVALVNLSIVAILLWRTLVHHAYTPSWMSHWVIDSLLFLLWIGATGWAWRGKTGVTNGGK